VDLGFSESREAFLEVRVGFSEVVRVDVVEDRGMVIRSDCDVRRSFGDPMRTIDVASRSFSVVRVVRVVRVGSALVLGGLVLGACNLPGFGADRGATTQGHSTFHLFQFFAILSIPVLLSVFVPLVYAILRFKRRGDEIPKQTHSHIPIEIVYTVVPIIIIVVLFVFTVRVENKVTAVSAHPNLRVDVTAYQWGWKFYYPSLGITEYTEGNHYPDLVLPENETTTVRLVSSDVVHGFYIPAFDFSRYALPGVTNYFDFTPNQVGSFIGRCSQLCGLYHSEMLFHVSVDTPAGFNAWASSHSSNSKGA
jgi:cytochrome c oxidase subunit 2